MPSIMFHELIGYKFAKKNKKYDNSSFYLGLLVPDAVNAYGFATKEKRWDAHFRDKNLDKWQENILKFYQKNREKYEENYLIGYVIHVLTDILCDKVYQEELYPELLKEGYDYDSAYSYYEEGIKKFENSKINDTWWEYVKKCFQDAEIIEINNISKEMIKDWVDYTINKYSKRTYEEESYITDKFADEVLEKLEILL